MAYIPKKDRSLAKDIPVITNQTKTSSMQDIFDAVDKLNPDSSLLSSETSLSIVSDWIDTGCYALNAIFSGSLYKGVPVGRITGFVGPSSAGKTLIMNKIMANAQKKGYFATVWDTEAAVEKNSAEGVGIDSTRLKYYPVETIEDCRNQISLFLDKIIERKDPELKVIVTIDSLGNLASAKEIRDAQEGKDAADMGTRAKALKSMMRALTFKAAKARVAILFSNHVYANPAALHPELVKTQSGGSGPLYLASLLVQLSTRNEKIDKNEGEAAIGIAHSISGATIGALTVKNRFVPPFLKAEIYNNYRTGLARYVGLADMAIGLKVVEGDKTYTFKGEKIGFRSRWENDSEFWEKKGLQALEEALKEQVCYGNVNSIIEDAEALAAASAAGIVTEEKESEEQS